MKYKIGILASSAEELESKAIDMAEQLAKELSIYNIIIITGGSSGIPYLVAKKAAKRGIEVWGYPPKSTPNGDTSIYKKLFFIPTSFPFASNLDISRKYRNVISTANCDAGIIISGRWGTLNEFTNLYDMGKVIGVLTGTGGIADELPALSKKVSKKSKAKIILSNSPKKLIDEVIKELSRRKNDL